MNLFDPPSRLLLQAVPLAACPLSLLAPVDAAARPDTFRARIEALASMETLNAEILGSRSATKTLEHWCAVHGMAADATIKAERVRDAAKPADAAQRQRLAAGPEETVAYRRVRLICGDHVLSDADNWYVPSRLTPEMNHLLETTDIPFGKVVASLMPTRETFAVDVRWMPLPDGWELGVPPAEHPADVMAMPPVLFEHRAVLYDNRHRPFSEVDEHYTRAILDFGRLGAR